MMHVVLMLADGHTRDKHDYGLCQLSQVRDAQHAAGDAARIYACVFNWQVLLACLVMTDNIL